MYLLVLHVSLLGDLSWFITSPLFINQGRQRPSMQLVLILALGPTHHPPFVLRSSNSANRSHFGPVGWHAWASPPKSPPTTKRGEPATRALRHGMRSPSLRGDDPFAGGWQKHPCKPWLKRLKGWDFPQGSQFLILRTGPSVWKRVPLLSVPGKM